MEATQAEAFLTMKTDETVIHAGNWLKSFSRFKTLTIYVTMSEKENLLCM